MPTPFILLLVQASTALAAAMERTCYHITGEPTRHSPGRPKFIPCDPDAAVSNCCSESDLCMGNGICLGLDAFNAFTFQGCTHPDWPEACSHGFRWPDTISAGFYAHVWQCRYGYSTPYCTGQNASCCEDESGWVYLPRFSNIHLAGSTDYVIRDNSVNSGVGGDLGASDRIALGVGISLPFVAILVAVGQWLFPGARLWFWKKRKGSMKLKMDDEGGLLEESRENVFSDRSSGLEMPAAVDLGERQPSRYRDEIGVPGFDRALDTWLDL